MSSQERILQVMAHELEGETVPAHQYVAFIHVGPADNDYIYEYGATWEQSRINVKRGALQFFHAQGGIGQPLHFKDIRDRAEQANLVEMLMTS